MDENAARRTGDRQTKAQADDEVAVLPVVMLRLRSLSPVATVLAALVLLVACEVRVGDAPNPNPSTGSGASDATSGTGATRPVGSSTGSQGGDPAQTQAPITVSTSASSGQGGAGGGAGQGTGGDAIYQCDTDFVCDIQDDCVCPDCQSYVVCTNPANCDDDGICKPFVEGCQCVDCAGLPICGP